MARIAGFSLLVGFSLVICTMLPAVAKIPQRYNAPVCGSPTAATPVAGKGDNAPPVTDMYGVSEIVPAGAVLSNGQPMTWALHPRMSRGNQPQAGWTAVVPWGQVFISVRGDNSHNTRVEVRNLRLFVRPKSTNVWCQLMWVTTPIGAFFRTDFAGDTHVSGDQRIEPDGGRSFHPVAGSAIHFFPDHRATLPVEGITGLYADFEGRLIKDRTDLEGDFSRSSLVASAGADYWKSDTAPAGQVGVYNEDAGIGKFRRMSPRWRTYSINSTAIGVPSLLHPQAAE